MKKTRILFLVNPISGGKDKSRFPEMVRKYLDHLHFDDEIRYWTDDKDAREMTRQAIHEGFEVIVAVGGDGTIHQVADVLRNSEVQMGIIPMGSGNGFARHLGIPLQVRKALEALNKRRSQNIDVLSVNGKFFVNMAGTGFDARIGYLFAHAGTRGFWSYVQLTVKELFSYKPQSYVIEVDGRQIQTAAFLISFANGSQWGNNAQIAPKASVSDGKGELCIMKPFKWYQVPGFVLKMFSGSAHKSSLMHYESFQKTTVYRPEKEAIHLDGEPLDEDKDLHIEVHPGALRVMV